MKKIYIIILVMSLLMFPIITMAQTEKWEMSNPKVGPSVYQEKNELYEWTTKYISFGNKGLVDSLYYSIGKSSFDMNTFVLKYANKRKEDYGYFAFKYFVTKKSPTETVLEMIPIPRGEGFLFGYNFWEKMQYERVIIRKNPKSGVDFTSFVTWFPSKGEYYNIVDRVKEIVTFDFNKIKADGDKRLQEIGIPKITVPTLALKGLERKYDKYYLSKVDTTGASGNDHIKSITPNFSLEKKVSKEITIYLSTDGSNKGVMNKKAIDGLVKYFERDKYKKINYKNATVYSGPIRSDGYHEFVIVPSKKYKNMYYVGNVSLETDRYGPQLKKEEFNKFMPDVKIIREEMIKILPSTESYLNILRY